MGAILPEVLEQHWNPVNIFGRRAFRRDDGNADRRACAAQKIERAGPFKSAS